MRTIVVGSRQSALALTQTGHVIEDLNALCAEHGLDLQFVVKKILTKGDRILDVTLSKVGGKGLFVKEIEQAMLAGEIDMAVHSMKDMPSELPEGLVNGAVPRREDPRDCLITLGAKSLEDLPPGAKVGTSSLRRASQIKSMRPDLQLEPVRGNIDSRLKKLETEGFDAIILAAAGLHRMGWKDRITSYIPEEACLPAVGQGALGIECRASDEELLALLKLYNHQDTSATVAAERTFLGVLNGGCQVPIGAHAVWTGQEISLTGMVGSPDGEVILKETLQGNDPQKLGEAVAASLIAKGAEQILAQVRG
ncbi:hydroxymethylbilane synthase [Paenibacillus polymyxa]|uniref:hydroxymethylbilane synthase n=1 Tax=Paenibacillus polymyxa TaxID=1406 RepID=UPI0025B67D25|nr:hydroxymethylbilane synthase [Paenibacillus polymyxa]MDN4085884.1 hydroxymethylbilane synthase [Paenibacillus polymyxa]MDN4111237.1 hydroxymethylbilane synthase [Paenibacillus polymyxa]